MCCSASNCLHVFYCWFCYWVLVLMHCDNIVCMGWFLFSYICWGLVCSPRYDWFSVPWAVRTMYIVQKLDQMFCRHQLGSFDLLCDLVLEFLYWFFLDHLSINDRGALKSPTTPVLVSIYVFRSFRVCLMKLGALTLGEYKLIIVILFWYISPFISMKYPSLSHLINVSLKSTMSKISSCLFLGGALA
jgi:hypothetical protein